MRRRLRPGTIATSGRDPLDVLRSLARARRSEPAESAKMAGPASSVNRVTSRANADHRPSGILFECLTHQMTVDVATGSTSPSSTQTAR